MGKAQTKSLVDDVLAKVVGKKPGFASWFERLSPDAQAELLVVRQTFDPRVHQKNAFASAIMAACAERGWETSGRQGVIDWLDKR